MKKIILLFLILVGALVCLHVDVASAQTPTPTDYSGPMDQVGAALQAASTNVMNTLTGIAFKVLFGLSMIKFILLGIKQMQSGDIEMTLGKWVMAFSWVGFIVWLMSAAANPVAAGLSNGANFIQSTVNYFLGVAATLVGGTPGNSFDAGDVMNLGLTSSHSLIVGVAKATVGSVGAAVTAVILPETTLLTALMLMIMNLIILASCAYIALKIFMVKIETALVIAITPLSFALAGLDALKDHGMAPFKSLLTIIFRIIVLASIVSAMTIVSKNLTTSLATVAGGAGVTDIWTTLLAAIFGYVLLAFLAHKSDAIAASLCSGSSMFGSSDVFGAAAMGAAMGAAVASGGASAASAATKIPQSMSDFKKSMADGGGSVSNATPGTGTGGNNSTQMAPAPERGPSSSIGPKFETGKNGVPLRPEGTGSPASTLDFSSSANSSSNAATPSPLGSGANAGIGGVPSATPGDSPGAPGGRYKKSFLDHLGDVNHHAATEKTVIQANLDSNAHNH